MKLKGQTHMMVTVIRMTPRFKAGKGQTGKKTSAGTFCIDFCNTSTISKIILIVHLLILKKKIQNFPIEICYPLLEFIQSQFPCHLEGCFLLY